MSTTTEQVLEAARAAGYEQMAGHALGDLVERLQSACMGERELAAALRGAAAALEEAAERFALFAHPDPVGYVLTEAGERSYWCPRCVPQHVRTASNEVFPGSECAQEGDCCSCGRWLGEEEQR